MLCGGESMSRELAAELLRRGKELWNLYGPTETTIWSSVQQVKPDDHIISIGRPIANTRMYILDRRLQPVPVGVTGELYIAGDGVARGYLNRPDLTAERFVADPFCTDANSRMYRTGDLARYRPDGTIECLGRLDHQVKIRGFRIELGEIESAMTQHADVRQAVVIDREDTPGDRRLVAYWIATGAASTPVEDLRRHLRERLPEYMVPSAFVELDAFPLTPNGKIDRRALPAPNNDRQELGPTFVAPRDAEEQVLAEIWSQLLGRSPIGINDNFFELGGHSLLATRLVSKIRERTGVGLPLRTVFDAPTLAGLAQRIRTVVPVAGIADTIATDVEEGSI
jgi:acyl-coenzyme A synthetase/AMP-(fatty) acid ligase/acyl carrier protein